MTEVGSTEDRLKVAHEGAVAAVQALAALSHDRTVDDEAREVFDLLRQESAQLRDRIHAERFPQERKRFAMSVVVEAPTPDEAFEYLADTANSWHTDPETVFLSNPRRIHNIDDYDGDEVAWAVVDGEPLT